MVRFRPKAPFAGVAQLAEQLICNQPVAGSIPVTGSTDKHHNFIRGKIPERPNGSDCKSDVFDFGGSNPPLPTTDRHPFSGACLRGRAEMKKRRPRWFRARRGAENAVLPLHAPMLCGGLPHRGTLQNPPLPTRKDLKRTTFGDRFFFYPNRTGIQKGSLNRLPF